MGECNQVSAWDFVGGLAEPFTCHAGLKVAWEEAIVFANDHMDWNFWPRLEVGTLIEGDLGLPTFVCGSLFGDTIRNVVEEVRCGIELDAVTAALGRRNPRFAPTGVIPPLPSGFAGKRDHCIHEDEHPKRRARATTHKGSRECTHRLGNECNVVSIPDRGYDTIGVGV
jgi:hypothetical protein